MSIAPAGRAVRRVRVSGTLQSLPVTVRLAIGGWPSTDTARWRLPSTSYTTVTSYVPASGIMARTSTRPTYRTRAPPWQVPQRTSAAPRLSVAFSACTVIGVNVFGLCPGAGRDDLVVAPGVCGLVMPPADAGPA